MRMMVRCCNGRAFLFDSGQPKRIVDPDLAHNVKLEYNSSTSRWAQNVVTNEL